MYSFPSPYALFTKSSQNFIFPKFALNFIQNFDILLKMSVTFHNISKFAKNSKNFRNFLNISFNFFFQNFIKFLPKFSIPYTFSIFRKILWAISSKFSEIFFLITSAFFPNYPRIFSDTYTLSKSNFKKIFAKIINFYR